MSQNRSYYISNRKEMYDFLPETCTRVLEIGCGEGIFLDGIKCDEK